MALRRPSPIFPALGIRVLTSSNVCVIAAVTNISTFSGCLLESLLLFYRVVLPHYSPESNPAGPPCISVMTAPSFAFHSRMNSLIVRRSYRSEMWSPTLFAEGRPPQAAGGPATISRRSPARTSPPAATPPRPAASGAAAATRPSRWPTRRRSRSATKTSPRREV